MANEAAHVVLPTPPFPDVMQTIRPLSLLPLSTEDGCDRTKECELVSEEEKSRELVSEEERSRELGGDGGKRREFREIRDIV